MDEIKKAVAQMIIDGDINFKLNYDNYEHELTLIVEVSNGDEEYEIEQDMVRF